MHEDYQPSSSVQLHNTFSYSADQIAVQQDYGYPTRFTILFGEENRLETWYFDSRGYTVVFMNGTQTSEKHAIPQYREGMYATTFTPGQFYSGMGVEEIVLATGQEDFQLSTIEGESFEERLMHMQGLGIGLQDGRINYVETYPAMTERELLPSDFAPPPTLTAEETANEGAHEYLVVVYVDDEFFDSYNSLVDVQFAQDKVCLTENDETYCFMRVSENHYVSEEFQTRMAFILDGFIWNMDDEEPAMEVLFSRMDD